MDYLWDKFNMILGFSIKHFSVVIIEWFSTGSLKLVRWSLIPVFKVHFVWPDVNSLTFIARSLVNCSMNIPSVYRVSCDVYEPIYVGQKIPALKTTTKEHRTNFKLWWLLSLGLFDCNIIKILDTESKYNISLNSEMFHIRLNNITLNVRMTQTLYTEHII